MKKETIKKPANKVVSWDTHLDKKYGLHGTATRSEFEIKSQTFILGELLKEEREKALSSGFTDYLIKPLSPEVLLATLSKYQQARAN